MPIHDWARVDHGTFHDFHQGWAVQIRTTLNNGLLPADYEAKVEQHTEDGIPDVLKLRKTIAIRQVDEKIVALLELVSPGNKSSRHSIQAFVRKVVGAIDHGIHVLVVDLFAPGPRDPDGIHPLIWSEFRDEPYFPPPGRPLTLAAYEAGSTSRAYIQPAAIGEAIPEMPLFLAPGQCINVPLESTYATAYAGIPRRTRELLGK